MKESLESKKWKLIVAFFSNSFADGESVDLDTILFLIGVQELGKGKQIFKKNQKLDLMHIAVCRVLEPFGYYKFDKFDEDGWPHYVSIESLPELKANEQTLLMKQAIIQYFEDESILTEDFEGLVTAQ